MLSGGRSGGRNSSRFFLSYNFSGRPAFQPTLTTGDCGSGLFFPPPCLSQVWPLKTAHPIPTALGCPSNGGSKNVIHGSLRCRKMTLNISFLRWWELEAPGKDLAESLKWAFPGIHWVTVQLAVMTATRALASQWEESSVNVHQCERAGSNSDSRKLIFLNSAFRRFLSPLWIQKIFVAQFFLFCVS